MNFNLKITDIRRYRYVAVDGTEPLRNYRKTKSLIQSRLKDTYPEFADMLAVPAIQSDGNIVWSTDVFGSLPRPLSVLRGEERERYACLLREAMSRLRDALKTVPASSDVAELHAIATVPAEDAIYCADNRVVITEWGLRPASGIPALSLLEFADTTEEGPAKPAAGGGVESEKVPEKKEEKVAGKVVVPPVPDEKTEKPEVQPEPEVKPEGPKPPIVVTGSKPEGSTGPTGPLPAKKKRKSRLWLWILIAILVILAILGAVLLLTRCTSTEKVADLPQTAPEISKDNIVLSEDSMVYVVNDRLNLMVADGGTLDEFIADFRKEYPDKEKYRLSAPDTLLRHVVLSVPSDELKELKNEIPVRMKPKYRVIVASESMNQSNYVPSDPAMKVGNESYYFDMVNAPEAWDIQRGDPDVVVAVLDDGFDTTHPEINGKVVNAYDMYRNTAGTIASTSGHGQHTSATAVGTADNGQGACGIAPDCKVMPVNVFIPGGGAPDSLIVKGLVYAAQRGAKVVSVSIGRSFGPQVKFLSVEDQLSLVPQILPDVAEMYDEVFRTLDEMGVTVVLSAGNETILTVLDPMKRSGYPIVVSAVDRNGDLAIFDPISLNGTNWGDRTDISAPGVDIYNAIPGGYDYMSGTSMSCPQVAGGAALLISQHPDLTPQEVKEVLVTTAVPVDENIGPLMDLAAALKADPSNLPANPGKKPMAGPGKGGKRGNPSKGYTDPFSFFYAVNPSPVPSPSPGQKPVQTPGQKPGWQPSQRPYRSPMRQPDPEECQQALLELQKLEQQYEALLKRYGACM